MFGDGSWAREFMLWLDSYFRGSGFTPAVPALVAIIGVVFVFSWLVRSVMAKLRQVSRR
jgi:flagellar biogenesis protein FliO